MSRGPRDADDRDAVKNGQGWNQHLDTAAKCGDQQEHFQDPGQGQKGVYHPHQHVIEFAADQSQVNTHKPAPQHGQGRGHQGHQNRLPAAQQGAGQHVTAQVVGTPPMGGIGRTQDQRGTDGLEIKGHQPGAGDGNEHMQQHQQQTDGARRPRRHLAQGSDHAPALASTLHVRLPAAVRSRGFATRVNKSAVRLTTT